MGAILGTVGSMLALFTSTIVAREICIVRCPNKHTWADSLQVDAVRVERVNP